MSIYELIEKMLADLNQTAQNILTTAQNLAVLRDSMKAVDKARIEEMKKLQQEKPEEITEESRETK